MLKRNKISLKPHEGKEKQHYIVEYHWNTYIFTVKKIPKERNMINDIDNEKNWLSDGLYFAAICCIIASFEMIMAWKTISSFN